MDSPQKRWVYLFDTPYGPAALPDKALFGGKGAGLRDMTALGLPVPPGFVLTTEVCTAFYQTHAGYPAHEGYPSHEGYPENLEAQVDQALQGLEQKMGLALGCPEKPLLLSVRSGAKASMPGMMDTVLNLGLNDQTVAALHLKTGDGRFAYDSYRRFIQMYSNVVLGISLTHFEEILHQYKMFRRVEEDRSLSEDDLRAVVTHFKKHVHEISGKPFPQDVRLQLWGAIRAVFESWMNPRAIAYRDLYEIPEDWGTAVVIQAMVFGNLGTTSGTGVAFTRNPSTGEKVFFGEYLLCAQGEDVVAGIRTPEPLTISQKHAPHQLALEEAMPEIYAQLVAVKDRLEACYRDMQDIEFTIQQGRLWLLQTRGGKRTAASSLKIAVDMVEEGLLTQEEALRRFDTPLLDQLLHPSLAPGNDLMLLGTGLPASPGAACGRVVFSTEACVERALQGEKVILVRDETSPEDIQGMVKSEGILTSCGGMTSHAAVVARGMGKPCIVGAQGLYIDSTNQSLTLNGQQIHAHEILTLDGTTGHIFRGEGRLALTPPGPDFDLLMGWADGVRRMRVCANADTVQDALIALEKGAEGIGLCRTEHMFFDAGRILPVREMILAATPEARKIALEKILPMQREDFIGIFRIMKGLPVTVRLLDPPLHEFLPRGDGEIDQLAAALGLTGGVTRARIAELHEANPMLGMRGSRLGITAPEIYEYQVRALIEAAAHVQDEGVPIHLEIMAPFISLAGEFRAMRTLIDAEALKVQKALKRTVAYTVGTMIELPRAAIKAGKIAESADFISFGTNDLTQTTFGLSRDDSTSFLGLYRQKGLIDRDPFSSLDQSGVGELIQLACERARATKPQIKLGICGEHGGDPHSILFFEKIGLDYVSCSPFRLPVARLASAQAVLNITRAQGNGA